MKTQFKTMMIAAAISLACISTYAQTPVQWSRTLQFEGYWEGPVTLNLGGQIFNLTYFTDFQTIIDGLGMTMIEGFNDPVLGELKGANLIGLNAADGLIHWSSVDNFGTAHEHIGEWLNPKHFYMEHQGQIGTQTFIERIDFRLRANNTKIIARLIATLDADTVQVLEGTLFKQNNRLADGSTITSIDEINIYPNPTGGEFDIESTSVINAIEVLNDAGKLIYKGNPNETDYSLRLDDAGVYFVRVTTAGKSETKKLVVIK